MSDPNQAALVVNGKYIGATFIDSSTVGYKNTTVETELDTLNQNLTQILNPEYVEVQSDGVKTIKTILAELYALVDRSKVNGNTYMLNDLNNGEVQKCELMALYSPALLFYTSNVTKSSNQYYHHTNTYRVAGDGSSYFRSCDTSTTTTSFGEDTTSVPPSGRSYRIYYR